MSGELSGQSYRDDTDLRALARGYREMLNDATAALFRIRDEATSRDEMQAAADEALRDLGLDDG